MEQEKREGYLGGSGAKLDWTWQIGGELHRETGANCTKEQHEQLG